jgi:hypothetical protein
MSQVDIRELERLNRSSRFVIDADSEADILKAGGQNPKACALSRIPVQQA